MDWTQFIPGLLMLFQCFFQLNSHFKSILVVAYNALSSLAFPKLMESLESRLKLSEDIPLELLHLIFAYLRMDLIKLASTCHYFQQAVRIFMQAANSQVFSYFNEVTKHPLNGLSMYI